MRENVKTSLFAVVAVAVMTSGAIAAPSVRGIGAGDASTAAIGSSARSGSLRTGALVGAISSKSQTPVPMLSGTRVGGSTPVRTVTTPRLSIGKYIGAPASISTSGGGGTGCCDGLNERITQLEREIIEKQDILHDSEYIYIDESTHEIMLDIESILELIGDGSGGDGTPGADGTDGREVEMGTNSTGLLWRYVGEPDSAWRLLISWADLSSNLEIPDIDLSGKVDIDQSQNAQAGDDVLILNANNQVVTGNLDDKYVKIQQSLPSQHYQVMQLDENLRVVPGLKIWAE
ncbi:MAG: hypothetical protein J6T57_04425 [Alphaproteobacteria bacterium]|nr:hypothetical protein [Alphaproteobacteria bacterium]